MKANPFCTLLACSLAVVFAAAAVVSCNRSGDANSSAELRQQPPPPVSIDGSKISMSMFRRRVQAGKLLASFMLPFMAASSFRSGALLEKWGASTRARLFNLATNFILAPTMQRPRAMKLWYCILRHTILGHPSQIRTPMGAGNFGRFLRKTRIITTRRLAGR